MTCYDEEMSAVYNPAAEMFERRRYGSQTEPEPHDEAATKIYNPGSNGRSSEDSERQSSVAGG